MSDRQLPAIQIRELGKSYKLGESRERATTLGQSLSNVLSNPVWKNRGRANEFWALRGVNVDIHQGDVLGVLGKNGAGKSTLLKILARVTEPTEGYAEVRGRIGSLLEVGTGFHHELSGRENIYLNAAILGMRKAEIERKFDEIVNFAEIERFIDTPVKHYSSGMYLRLAFAVAAHLEPEILLMDEVLAVGDASFQKKCIGKMGAVARGGRTVVFVSHNMAAIRELCTRAVWIDGGRVRAEGEVDEVVEQYISSLSTEAFSYESAEFGLEIQNVVFRDDSGNPTNRFSPGEDLLVEVVMEAKKPIRKPYFAVAVDGIHGRCFTANMSFDGCRPELLEGHCVIRCRFRELPLLPQSYTVKLRISASDGRQHILPLQEVGAFAVTGRLEDHGLSGEFYSATAKAASVIIPYEWQLPNGVTRPVSLRKPSLAQRAS